MDKIIFYMQYPFVRYAIIVGVLIALSSSLLGVTLVLKRFSYIGDGLSHVAFGAMAVASVLKMANQMALILPVTIICAVLLLRTGQNAQIKGDAAIAMISVGALAFGYLLMNIFSSSSNLSGDVCSTLFGSTSILTLTFGEVMVCIVLSILVIAIFVFLYNKIFAVTFDENFAQATGVRAEKYNFLVAVMIAVIIVLAMNLVGSLLISALVIFPALSAMRIYKSFMKVTVFSACISVLCAFMGIMISILAGTPVGSTIVAVNVIFFALCSLIGKRTNIKKLALPIAVIILFVNSTGCAGTTDTNQSVSNKQIVVSSPSVDDVLKEKAGSAGSNEAQQNGSSANSIVDGQNGSSVSGSTVGGQNGSSVSGSTADSKNVNSASDSTANGSYVSSIEGVDIDLTALSSTMVYSEVYNMMCYPETFLGLTIRMEGTVSAFYDENKDKYYYACIISDATACCSQGIEFELSDEYVVPDDYPSCDEVVVVEGVFETYEEDGYQYAVLKDSHIVE